MKKLPKHPLIYIVKDTNIITEAQHIQIRPFIYTVSSLLELMTWDAATNMDLIDQP